MLAKNSSMGSPPGYVVLGVIVMLRPNGILLSRYPIGVIVSSVSGYEYTRSALKFRGVANVAVICGVLISRIPPGAGEVYTKAGTRVNLAAIYEPIRIFVV